MSLAGDDRDSAKRARFVVHEHHARHLHWDLRLEHRGVLVSFAVPKTPPVEPKTRRLAIPVEDHELSYIDFEGEIPEGQYGAGTVKVWDSGEYELLSWGEKKIDLRFFGSKLKGRYVLTKMRDKQWLFFKTKSD